MTVHVCSFDAVDLTRPRSERGRRRRYLTYEEFRDRVLAAGRFSVFQATENDWNASMFTRLCRDPEIVTDNTTVGYPWTLVKKKEA